MTKRTFVVPLVVSILGVLPATTMTQGPGYECLTEAIASPTATPATMNPSQSATLQWNVQFSAGCADRAVWLDTSPVRQTESLTVQPNANKSYALQDTISGVTATLDTASNAVGLPPIVYINANDQAPLLVQALGTPNTVVHVANDVQMNLSSRSDISIASGVQLLGGRTPRERGARLYTTTFPGYLFRVAGDNVRISGLRIDGGEMGVADAGAALSVGIGIQSALNVEIDNNEIYGWRGSAVEVLDDGQRIALAVNSLTVRIHDNYIHHNQHQRREGYGVEVSHGAYALIEKNVFDWNRHAIAGDGSDDSGYFAYRNLVLENGGLNFWLLGIWLNTHMFDMHGQNDCGGYDGYCGPAGEYMDIRYNSMLYRAATGFKLRGTPEKRADAAHNVFAHDCLFPCTYPNMNFTLPAAFLQHETGLNQWDNLIKVDESDRLGRCDFDADGIEDRFFATGATWWFNSGGNRHWVYLNTSTRRLSELALSDVDGDGRCDVVSGGMVSNGGTGPWRPRVSSILWQHDNGALAVWRMDGGSILGEAYPGVVDGSWQIKGTGDFDGDGEDDILWQHVSGQVAIWYMSGGARIGEGYPGGNVPSTWAIQGVGDFDGDGLSDILWRDASGQLAIWFRGNLTDDLYPVVYPGYANVPAPVDPAWQVKGVGDFDGDGRSDILWRHTDGQVAIWRMAGGVRAGESYPGGKDTGLVWTIQDVGDFDGDGRSDILWRARNGQLAIWFKGDATAAAYPSYRNVPGPVDLAWRIQGVRDFDADGRTDILWRSDAGQVGIWLMSGAWFVGDVYPRAVDNAWQVKGTLGEWP